MLLRTICVFAICIFIIISNPLYDPLQETDLLQGLSDQQTKNENKIYNIKKIKNSLILNIAVIK